MRYWAKDLQHSHVCFEQVSLEDLEEHDTKGGIYWCEPKSISLLCVWQPNDYMVYFTSQNRTMLHIDVKFAERASSSHDLPL